MAERVVICGGGIIGSSTAYYLKKLDPSVDVTVIEAVSVASQASGKAGGFLAKSWNAHDANLDKLTRLSYQLHRELKDELGLDVGYRNLTTYSVSASEDLQRCILPKKSPDWIYSSKNERPSVIGRPEETAQVNPKQLTDALIARAKAKGTKVIIRHVTGLELNGSGRVVGVRVDNNGEQPQVFPADKVVLALGPWTQQIGHWLPRARHMFKFYSERAHSVVFENARVPAEAVFMCHGEEEVEIYPRPDETVYSCGYGDSRVPLPVHPSDVAADPESCRKLSSACRKLCPAVLKGAPLQVEGQACYLPFSADTKPVIGPVSGHDGVFVASGHGVWGILNAPATGLCLASTILQKSLPDCLSNDVFNAFNLSRFK